MDNRSLESGASATPPSPPASPSVGYPTKGNPATATPASKGGVWWYHQIGEELRAIQVAAGITPSTTNNAQLLEAIQRLIDAQSGNYALDTGAANAYVVAISPAITAYTDGMTVRIKASNANTGASTLNAGGGAVSLVNDVGGALVAGDVPGGSVFAAVYIASANKFYITSLVPSQVLTQAQADARYLLPAPSVTIASAATTNIGAAASSNVNISGTTTITAFDTVAEGVLRLVTYTGAVPITYNVTSMQLVGGASRTNAVGDFSIFRSLGSGNWKEEVYQQVTPVAAVSVPVRQTVLQGPVDTGGLPTFLPATSASLVVASQNISTGANSLVVTAAQGAGLSGAVNVVGQSTANLTWPACTANLTNFLPVLVNTNGTLTAQTPVTLAPVYQWGGTPAVTAGQYTFNIQQMTMYLGNGSTAPAVNHVIVGEVVAGASTITSTIPYAYMGRYDSGFTATLPAASIVVSKNHNLGTSELSKKWVFECTTTDSGYAIGDRLEWTTNISGGNYMPFALIHTSKTCGTTTSSSPYYTANKSTGVGGYLTAANWKHKFTVNRTW